MLALSNSGDTAELADIVAYCKRFRIPLIAVTRRQESTLAEAADVTLLLPAAAEACPMGLAPTTSTTMMMALGDALHGRRAIAVLDELGPGGVEDGLADFAPLGLRRPAAPAPSPGRRRPHAPLACPAAAHAATSLPIRHQA